MLHHSFFGVIKLRKESLELHKAVPTSEIAHFPSALGNTGGSDVNFT
jgi:hypothetical protein